MFNPFRPSCLTCSNVSTFDDFIGFSSFSFVVSFPHNFRFLKKKLCSFRFMKKADHVWRYIFLLYPKLVKLRPCDKTDKMAICENMSSRNQPKKHY